ncbi:hypothetical protein AQUCO_07500024v1 [Aquilegia coerulea]|uniref:Uncharacterized protein n=1 Tax=Aquilegia coerulea TaxID=218851 RepID=A0A2G5C967_AQUCA|nr:hypothetical protein AQUCO_07500024v1 [Aquilegia coerulea]
MYHNTILRHPDVFTSLLHKTLSTSHLHGFLATFLFFFLFSFSVVCLKNVINSLEFVRRRFPQTQWECVSGIHRKCSRKCSKDID